MAISNPSNPSAAPASPAEFTHQLYVLERTFNRLARRLGHPDLMVRPSMLDRLAVLEHNVAALGKLNATSEITQPVHEE